jgi:hypothetical protein
MQGNVYQIIRPGRYGNLPHLFVVAIELSGSGECLVVPAFGKEGAAVNDVIQAWLDQGHRIDQVAVELNNAQHIAFVGGHTGKVAYWLVADADRLPRTEFARFKHVGKMDADGLKLIAGGLLNYAGTTTRFSKALIKKIRQLCE